MQTWPETGGSGDGLPTRLPAPAPLPYSPTPHTPPCLFLPLPSAKSYKSEEITVPGASAPLSNIAVSGRRRCTRRRVPFLPPRRGPPRERSLCTRSPSCAVARAGSLLPRVWRCHSGARSLGKSPDRKSSVGRLKFGGRWGQPSGGVRREGLGSTVRPAASDSRHLPLPSVFQSGPERRVWARKQRTEGEAGGPPRCGREAPPGSRLGIRAPQGPRSEPA